MEGALDERTFAALLERHRTPLIHFFRRLTPDGAKAEDWAQEVLFRVYQARDRYEPAAPFATYLYRVARNFWIDCYRRDGRRPRELSLEGSGMRDENALASRMRERIADPAPSPSETVRKREVTDAVRHAVESLPPQQRMVFELAEDRGLKYGDIARTLGIPVGTVKSRMHAAMNRLREQLRARIQEA